MSALLTHKVDVVFHVRPKFPARRRYGEMSDEGCLAELPITQLIEPQRQRHGLTVLVKNPEAMLRLG